LPFATQTILSSHSKVYERRINPPIKFCCTWTDTAANTKSIGLQADARVVMVFACHLDNLILTRNFRPSTGTLQKRLPTLTLKATHQTAGPL